MSGARAAGITIFVMAALSVLHVLHHHHVATELLNMSFGTLGTPT